jgi:Gpi18-like mannosyltransferase
MFWIKFNLLRFESTSVGFQMHMRTFHSFDLCCILMKWYLEAYLYKLDDSGSKQASSCLVIAC